MRSLGFVLLILLASGSLAAGVEEASVSKFQSLVALPMGTAKYSEYLGVKEGKAYVVLHQKNLIENRWEHKEYWVKASELPESYLASIEAKRVREP